ncbi:MAG TPA: RNA polymerase sigma factor [Flavipsychrobacter sp.]
MTQEQETAFVQMIQQHQKLVYKVCSIYAAGNEEREDLAQEIILQAWKSYVNFKGNSAISTWLYKVSLNTAINYKRKQQRKPQLTYPKELLFQPEDARPETHNDEYRLLQQMIAGLPPLDKALILLYLEDKTYNEIAEIMGISASNAGTKLNRIKEKLKQQAKQLTQ